MTQERSKHLEECEVVTVGSNFDDLHLRFTSTLDGNMNIKQNAKLNQNRVLCGYLNFLNFVIDL